MEAINTIKVTVETTKTDSVVKPENTVDKGDTANSVAELEKKSSFSDTLKGEMKNKSDSQKNDHSDKNENTEGGNNLPDDSENAIAILDPLAGIMQIDSEGSDLSMINENVMPDGLVAALENKAMPEGLVAAFENKVMPEGLVNAIDNKDKNGVINSIQSIFQQISYGQSQLNDKAAPGVVATDILKSMIKNPQSNGHKPGQANENSLFQGSIAQLGAENLASGNMLSGFDLSANSQQNNNLNQQFAELQMRLLNQDKVLEESRFDITKLTQTITDTQKTSTINELNPINQTRSPVSELMIKTPVMDKQWKAEFNNHISFISKSGGGNAIIKLNPAHLGPVEASIRVVNEVATIQIAASHITTRDAMDAAIPRLKEMLEEQGFSKVNVDISEKGFSHNSSQQSEKTKDGTSSANDELVDEEEGDFSNKESMTVLGKSVSNGVVDYFA